MLSVADVSVLAHRGRLHPPGATPDAVSAVLDSRRLACVDVSR